MAQVTNVGHIDAPSIPESSGIVASRKHPGVYWTHNDSGNPPELFAITREGKLINTFPVGATNRDWEDISIDDEGRLYIGEIGNNGGRLDELAVYRVDEPDPNQKPAAGVPPLKVNETWKLRFPEKPFDCESLFVWKGQGFVVSKLLTAHPAALYRFDLKPQQPGKPTVLDWVTDLPIRSPATAADISADGRQLAIMTVIGPYLFDIAGDPANAGRAEPRHIFFLHPNMEAVCFAPDGLLATTERRDVFLFKYEDFGKPQRYDRATVAIDAHRAAKPPTIDGDLSDWNTNVDPAKLRCTDSAAAAADSPRVWMLWGEKGLYLAAIVPREKIEPLRPTWFTGDAIELFLGPHAPDRKPEYGPGDDRCYLGFSANPDGTPGRLELHWPRDDHPPADARGAGRINSDGTYQVEVFLPASILGDAMKPRELRAEEQIRLNVSVLSRDPRRNWFLSESNDAGTWLSPLTWAVVTLK